MRTLMIVDEVVSRSKQKLRIKYKIQINSIRIN